MECWSVGVDPAEQRDVRDTILEALKRRPVRLVLDLSRLSFIDSSGVHVLTEAVQRSAEQDTRLMMCRVHRRCTASSRYATSQTGCPS
jgi:anti-anti-sigma factor